LATQRSSAWTVRDGFARDDRARVDVQPHAEVGVGVVDGGDELAGGDVDAELLAQFALQRLRVRLAGLHLAAGEFP